MDRELSLLKFPWEVQAGAFFCCDDEFAETAIFELWQAFLVMGGVRASGRFLAIMSLVAILFRH